jgi:hypothetical protein
VAIFMALIAAGAFETSALIQTDALRKSEQLKRSRRSRAEDE